MTTVWIYVDTSKQVGDVDHLKVFATPDAAEEWFKENDPEGVAFQYEVLSWVTTAPNPDRHARLEKPLHKWLSNTENAEGESIRR